MSMLTPGSNDGLDVGSDVAGDHSAFEAGSVSIGALAAHYATHLTDRNEATTRLHLIDTLVFDCLGWRKHDAIAEEEQRTAGRREFTDYTFYAPRKVMILEAKREGAYFEVPAGKLAQRYAIKSLCRGNSALRNAVEQVATYCQSRGVPLAAACNGHQLVAFVATRADGVPPLDGHCVVFPSLPFMAEHFVRLWNLLSKPGIEDKTLERFLLGTDKARLPSPLAASLVDYPGRKDRNIFQTDLKILTDLVIEDIANAPELEQLFLKECYCAPGALSQHSLATKSILAARYSALFDKNDASAVVVPAIDKKGISNELLADSLSRRPILLLGDVGVGKTTFIRHLITIEGRDVLVDALTFYVDLGTQATLTGDLHAYIVDHISVQLRESYKIDVEEDGFVRAIYRSETTRFRKGIFGPLAETDPVAFRTKEIDLLSHKIRNRAEHLRASLEHLAKERKKQIIVVLDNADQRGDATQDAAFLIAQEMSAHWPVIVWVPLRPETFHESSRKGALTGYHPKAFTVSPPRIDRVVERRLEFAIRLAEGKVPFHIFPGALQTKVELLKAVIKAFLSGVERNHDLIEFIDNLSGGNVRAALQYVKAFFGSGHVDTEKIAREYERAHYAVTLHEFFRATLFGDAEYYNPQASPIANLFSISTLDPREHFLLPLIIGTLGDASASQRDRGFVAYDELYRFAQGSGFTPDQVDFALIRGYRRKLFETPGHRSPEDKVFQPTAVRATTSGLFHALRLANSFGCNSQISR